jgi:hypothetical protein
MLKNVVIYRKVPPKGLKANLSGVAYVLGDPIKAWELVASSGPQGQNDGQQSVTNSSGLALTEDG